MKLKVPTTRAGRLYMFDATVFQAKAIASGRAVS
jgi:hypothetical protein